MIAILASKKSKKSSVGQVKAIDEEECEIQFMKRVKSGANHFVFNDNDISWIPADSISRKLACPSLNKREQYIFTENLEFVQ